MGLGERDERVINSKQCSYLRLQVQGVDANSSLIVALLLRGSCHGAQEHDTSIYMLYSWALYILRFDDGSSPTSSSWYIIYKLCAIASETFTHKTANPYESQLVYWGLGWAESLLTMWLKHKHLNNFFYIHLTSKFGFIRNWELVHLLGSHRNISM